MKCERCYEFDCVCDGRDPFNAAEITKELMIAREAVRAIRMLMGGKFGSAHQSGISMHHLPWGKRWDVYDAMVDAGFLVTMDSTRDYATLRSKSTEPEFTFFIDVPKELHGEGLNDALMKRPVVELS